MSYSNGYSRGYSYDSGYARSHSGNRSRYVGGNQRGYSNDRPRKSSGCKIKIDADGNCFINAWKKKRRGPFLTLSMHYFVKSKFRVTTGERGDKWVFVLGEITNHTTGELIPMAGTFNITKQRCYLNNKTIATLGGAGGYWGKQFSSEFKPRR